MAKSLASNHTATHLVAMGDDREIAAASKALKESDAGAVEAFVREARSIMAAKGEAAGRLILALDATMSRQPTWDLATQLQGHMFDSVSKIGTLDMQLVYFRGLAECRASKFVRDTASLKSLMTRIDCRAGKTQIGKVLAHAVKENGRQKVAALVYIGDAIEEELDALAMHAGNLGLRGVPVFLFQEGKEPEAERAFREIARLSNGAWFRFDRNAAARLAQLLSSIAVFATSGLKGLEQRGRPGDLLLLENLRGGGKA